MPKKAKVRETGLTVVEMPMAQFQRQILEGSAELMRHTLNVAEQAIRTGDHSTLKDGVDPIVLHKDQAKLLGECELILRLDDEARARAKR